MNMASHCKKAGMNLAQFNEYVESAHQVADRLLALLKDSPFCGTGTYTETGELLCGVLFREDIPDRDYVLRLLKDRGVEFYDNATLCRY